MILDEETSSVKLTDEDAALATSKDPNSRRESVRHSTAFCQDRHAQSITHGLS